MESFFVRYRNLLVLLAILVAQMVGLAVQVRGTGSGPNSLDTHDQAGVRLIRLWANGMVSPPERFFHGIKAGLADLWLNYLDLRGVRAQNKQLQQTIDRLRLEQATLLSDARQGERLQKLLGFQEKYIYKTTAAEVIGSSGSNFSHVFYIDKGSAEGIARDMAVVTPDGIVGKVRDVFAHSAQVLAINDQSSGAGVILETTRIRGIVRGNAAGQLEVVGIMADERIKPGENVLTAGGDLVFPRGLPVGTVVKVVPDPDRDSFVDVMLKPAAQLSRLDEVLVITSLQSRFSPQEQQDLATSEALKGAEAQAIQNQLKASQIMAERLPSLTQPPTSGIPITGVPQTAPGQPGQAGQTPGQAAPAQPPAPKLLPTIHPDRYSPSDEAPAAPAPDASGAARPTHPTGSRRKQ